MSGRRVLLSSTGALKGEAEGASGALSTQFFQDSSTFTAADNIQKQIDELNGALGLVPSILVVALSVLCALSL